jgi:60 kDa SS-A/Ro ribonucleoprotein
MAGHLNKQGTPTPDCNRQFLRLISRWYELKDADALAYQVAKYQQREKWSHADVLRLLHQKPTEAHAPVFKWVVKGWDGSYDLPRLLEGFEKIKQAQNATQAAALILEYKLPRECVPTQFLNDREVWSCLLDDMPMTAMIRNLGKMSAIELLTYKSEAAKTVCERLTNADALRKARVHPIALLSALRVYEEGHGIKGSLTWKAVSSIKDALDGGFYLAFKNVEPTGKNILLALDISGSMGMGEVAGVPGLTPSEASCALALVTVNTEPNVEIVGYTSGSRGNDGVSVIPFNKSWRIADACNYTAQLPMGGTDCSLPVKWADKNKKSFDGIVSYTDSETWAGGSHLSQDLRKYRAKIGIPTRHVVVGLTSTGFSVNDKNDPYGLDVVGFDSSGPAILSSFIAGRI